MALSQISSRFGAVFNAALIGSTLLVAAPQAQAASKTSYYKVELSQASSAHKKIVRGVFFNCEGTSCTAPMAASTPRNVCITVARELGEIASFKAGNRSFNASELVACNEKAPASIAKN